MRLLQSLTRGLQVLDCLRTSTKPMRLTDIANELGIAKANASHLLHSLVAAGYVGKDKSRKYQATAKVHTKIHYKHSLDEIVSCKEAWRPVLEELVASTGECVHLAVLVKDQVWYIDKVESTLPLKVDHPVGALTPLHCTALGKAFLAFGTPPPSLNLARYTEHTITTNKELERDIVRSRERGYTQDNEEFSVGIRCAGGPIFDADGAIIAAISISGPTARISEDRLAELGQIVVAVIARQKKINSQ